MKDWKLSTKPGSLAALSYMLLKKVINLMLNQQSLSEKKVFARSFQKESIFLSLLTQSTCKRSVRVEKSWETGLGTLKVMTFGLIRTDCKYRRLLLKDVSYSLWCIVE